MHVNPRWNFPAWFAIRVWSGVTVTPAFAAMRGARPALRAVGRAIERPITTTQSTVRLLPLISDDHLHHVRSVVESARTK
jgi:hypothetical protein